jgi:hypothetical protein
MEIQQLIVAIKDTLDVKQDVRLKSISFDVDNRFITLGFKLKTEVEGIAQVTDRFIHVTDKSYRVPVVDSAGYPVLDENGEHKTIGEFTFWHLSLLNQELRTAIENAAKADLGLISENPLVFIQQ